MVSQKEIKIDPEFTSIIKKKYSPISEDELEKIIEGLQTFLLFAQNQRQSLKSILEHAARVIYRLFEFREVAIGLKSEKDGLYRYEILLGFTKKSEAAHKRLSYTYDEMVNPDKYPHIKVDQWTDFCIAESVNPEKEDDDIATHNRPLAISRQRDSFEEFKEGDYIDINIFGDNKELIGWIEVANTRNEMLPSRKKIKWLGMIGSILGIIIQRELKG